MFLIEQIKEVIQRKDLLAYLVSSELQTLYRNKALGFLWAVLDPLFLMLVYVVLVVVIFQRGDPQFPILLFSALIAWRWFISDLSASTRVIVANAKLIQTVKFPVTIFPLSRVLIGFINYLMGLVVLIPMLWIFKATFSWNMLWLPAVLVTQFFFSTGVAMLVSYIGVYFRDLQNIIQFAVRIVFYLSPGIYSLHRIPEEYLIIYVALNPFASLFNTYKNILVRGEAPSTYFLIFVAYAAVVFLIGARIFYKKRNSFAKDV